MKKEENESKQSKVNKIIESIVLVIFILLFKIIASYSIYIESNLYKIIREICYLIIIYKFILLLWKKTNIKKALITIAISLIILLASLVYYVNWSMKIGPLIHLHRNYNFKYSDMKIIDSTRATHGDIFGHDSEARSATIKYKEYEILVYYYNGWKDNYEEYIRYEKNNKKYIKDLSTIITSNTNEFKILNDPQIEDKKDNGEGFAKYNYIVFINSQDNNKIENIIKQMDKYVNDNKIQKDTQYQEIQYDLFIIKNKILYNELVNIDISSLELEKENIYIDDYETKIFKALGYNSEVITSSESFNKDILINNGDKTDENYQNPENFKDIVFKKGDDFKVIGIK